MRTILLIIQKEFRQIFRDKFLGRAIFLIPVIQMMVLVYAATFELKYVKLFIVDQDRSQLSSQLTIKYQNNPFFRVEVSDNSDDNFESVLKSGEADLVMVMPNDFERDFTRQQKSEIQLLVDAVNGSAAQLSLGYCRAVIQEFSRDMGKNIGISGTTNQDLLTVHSRFWYNPFLDYKIFMAPGILVVLVTVIGWLLAGMNLVKEKELGTIEQLNVTPILKYQFLLGKMIPFLVIGLVDLAFGLIIAWLLYDIPIEGSLALLFLFASIYLVAVLGLGLFISTVSHTQQQVLFVSYFFMIIFILMSGLFTSVENMPEWAQIANYLNPMAHFSKVIRMVLLKGSGILNIMTEITIMVAFAIIINSLAVWRYKKTV